MEITYRIEKFEGTLDALIEDIRDGRVSIYNVPIASIVEQFKSILSEIANDMEIADLTFFYRMVAELLYKKIQIFLPSDGSGNNENEEDLLRSSVIDVLERLKFSKYTELLKKYRETHSVGFSRSAFPFRLPFTDQDLLAGVNDVGSLCKTFMDLLKNRKPEEMSEISFSFGSKISEQSKRALLIEMLDKRDRILFTELVGDLSSMLNITSSFFAVLNSIYEGFCTFSQENVFDDFYIMKVKKDDISGVDADRIDREYDELVEERRRRDSDADNFEISDEE